MMVGMTKHEYVKPELDKEILMQSRRILNIYVH